MQVQSAIIPRRACSSSRPALRANCAPSAAPRARFNLSRNRSIWRNLAPRSRRSSGLDAAIRGRSPRHPARSAPDRSRAVEMPRCEQSRRPVETATDQVGEIYFRHGQICHAITGTLEGGCVGGNRALAGRALERDGAARRPPRDDRGRTLAAVSCRSSRNWRQQSQSSLGGRAPPPRRPLRTSRQKDSHRRRHRDAPHFRRRYPRDREHDFQIMTAS